MISRLLKLLATYFRVDFRCWATAAAGAGAYHARRAAPATKNTRFTIAHADASPGGRHDRR